MERDGTLVKTINEGVDWVRERDQFVFITDGPMLKHIANQPPCDLKIGKYQAENVFSRSGFFSSSHKTKQNNSPLVGSEAGVTLF